MLLFYLIVILSAVPNHPWFGEEVAGVSLIKYVGVLALLYAVVRLMSGATLPALRTWPARLFPMLAIWALCSYQLVTGVGQLNGSPFMLYLSFCLVFFVDGQLLLVHLHRGIEIGVLHLPQ